MPPLLLVEDNTSTREAVKVVLEAEGYPVVAAANGPKPWTQTPSGWRAPKDH